jgi:hypothetical protein
MTAPGLRLTKTLLTRHKKQMRREASHLTPHRSWISNLACPPLGATGRRCWSDSAHQECHFYQHWPQNRDSKNRSSAAPAAASGPTRSEERVVEEAAMPGQPVRTRARFPISPGNSPSRIAGCHQRHRKHRWQVLRFATFSLNPLSARMSRPATQKPFAIVQKLWTVRLPCGKLRKSAQESRQQKCVPKPFNNLDAVKK